MRDPRLLSVDPSVPTFPRERSHPISLAAAAVVAVLVLLALAWTVWPGPWRYFENDGWQYREHRLSGEVQEFGTDAWGGEAQ